METAIGVFILPPSKAELERRLTGRGQDSQQVIDSRMAQAVSEMSHYAQYEFIIVNDDFDNALADLSAIIRSQRLTCASQQHAQNDMIVDLLAD